MFSLAPGGTTFSNFLDQGYDWFVNKNDSVVSFDFVKVASLDENGNLNITGNFTANQIQLRGFEPKHTCDSDAAGQIIYEQNGSSGDFFGCRQLNNATFGWFKL